MRAKKPVSQLMSEVRAQKQRDRRQSVGTPGPCVWSRPATGQAWNGRRRGIFLGRQRDEPNPCPDRWRKLMPAYPTPVSKSSVVEDTDTPVVALEGVSKSFGSQKVLHDVDFRVHSREVVTIVGPSGSGKSTLCRCINGLERIDEGEVSVTGERLPVEGRELARVRADVGMVFQSFNLFAHKTVLENITLGPIVARGTPRAEAEERARELLQRVGMRRRPLICQDVCPEASSSGQQ